MDVTSLVLQLISGAAGGNVAGALLKKSSLGPVGSSIAGLLGGGLGGQLFWHARGGRRGRGDRGGERARHRTGSR